LSSKKSQNRDTKMSCLIEYLRKLDPSGEKGFEGLIARLLEYLTGTQFYLARSGSQSGRDMISVNHDGSVIAVECKRYGQTTELNERELLGELAQASLNISDLDLWVLVTSRQVPDQLFNSLNQYAMEQGIEFRTISAGDGSPCPSTLESLCAYGRQVVLDFFVPIFPEQDVNQLRCELENIINDPNFEMVIKVLQNSFTACTIGYEHWRIEQNKRLIQRFSEEKESRSSFGQVLHVNSVDVNLVRRTKVWEEINNWLSSWGDKQQCFVLLGEEGDGKTWAVASWINCQIQKEENFPPVIFLSSTHTSSSDPASLLSEAIAMQIRQHNGTFWDKRLKHWIKRPAGRIPLILLVLDGINERHTHQWWRELIEKLMGSPWREQIAILITVRTDYWNRYFSSLRHLDAFISTLSPYDDIELNDALRQYQLSLSDIDDNLLPLIRKPRYLDLVVKHRERMAEIGDITVRRLIYEDWKDRWSRKTKTFLSDQQFQVLIKQLAGKAIKRRGRIYENDITEHLSLYKDKLNILDDLVSGDIVHSQSAGSYKVDEQRLILGLGLMLADQLEEAADESATDIDYFDNVIAEWLEPHREMDIKAAIIESATIHALELKDNYPEICQVALLKAWLESKNLPEKMEENFIAYLPIHPVAYMKLAEIIWTDIYNNPWGQTLFMRALLKWRNSSFVQDIFLETFKRWLSFIHPGGHPLQRLNNKSTDELKKKIVKRAGKPLKHGSVIEFAGYLFTVINDDGLLRLGRVALAVISYLSRKPYIRAITIGCLAEAIMDYAVKYELFAWVIRSSPESLWPEIEQQVNFLLQYNNIVTKQVAFRLLSFEGSEYAIMKQKELPDDLFPSDPLLEMHKKDPCNSIFAWNRDEAEQCLKSQNITPSIIARKIKEHSCDPEFTAPLMLSDDLASLADRISPHKIWLGRGQSEDDYFLHEFEPALYAYAPESVAKLYNSIAKTANDRNEIALRQLVLQLRQHTLILDEEAKKILQAVWNRLIIQSKQNSKSQHNDFTEEFLFDLILQDFDAENQLRLLIQRPENATDLYLFEHSFKPINNWDFVTQLLKSENTIAIRRVLWFLAANHQDIPDDVMSIIWSLIEDEDSCVRSFVLKLLYWQESEEYIKNFIHGKWAWNVNYCEFENHWGSLILAKYGIDVPYNELRCRIHPLYLGFALTQRGLDKVEINQYAEDIQRIWKTLLDSSLDIPSDFPESEVKCDLSAGEISLEKISLSDTLFSRTVEFISRDAFWGGISGGAPVKSQTDLLTPINDNLLERLGKILQKTIKEQKQAGNIWFCRSFSKDGLKEVIKQRPDLELVNIWIKAIKKDSQTAQRRLIMGQSFYSSLCEVLLSIEPSKGLELYQILNTKHVAVKFVSEDTKIPILRYALFKAPDISEIRRAWEQCLDRCRTDQDLLELVITAMTGNGVNWLENKIKDDITSNVMYKKARAIIIQSFLDSDNRDNLFIQNKKPYPETWKDRVIAKACFYWQINKWAKHWFKRFLTAESDVDAWAAFRLLLRCVDRRFWLWQEDIRLSIANGEDRNDRIVFLAKNRDILRNSIEQNEKVMAETFLATKVLKNQIWPWMVEY